MRGEREYKMKIKQQTEHEQQDMKSEHSMESKQVNNTPDNMTGEDDSTDKRKILERIWTFCLQHKHIAAATCLGILLGGIGTFLSGIDDIRPDTSTLILKGEDIVKFIQATKSGETSQVEESLQKVEQNPKASVIDKAIVAAYRLHEDKRIEEAMEKWSSIANIAEGIDDDLASRAWFSVGYLYSDLARGLHSFGSFYMEGVESESAISAYDRAIHLKPDFVEAYFNRGISKKILSQYDETIADFSKVITLKPDFAEAYSERGNIKNILGQYSAAITDANEALRLKPDLPNAYAVRGEARMGMNDIEEAKTDFETALRLADKQEDEDLKVNLERRLQTLDDNE